MSRPEKAYQVFEYLRTSKTELSQEQVQEIIKRLPTLPIPKGGHPSTLGFNFYTIIMNSIIVISLMSGLLFLIQPQKKQEILSEDISVKKDLPQEFSTPAPTLISPNAINETRQSLQENSPKKELAPEKVLDTTASFPVEDTEVQTEDNSQDNTSPKNILPLQKNPASNLRELEEFEQTKAPEISDRKAPPVTFKGKAYFTHMSPVKISQAGMQELKKRLLKSLKQDALLEKGKQTLVLKYTNSSMQINGRELASEQSSRYKKILESYGISPGRDRQVQVIQKFILVGDFDTHGQLVKGIVEGSGYIELTELAYNPHAQETGLFAASKKGHLNISRLVCDTELQFQGDIKKLKQELLRNLLMDDLLSAEKEENRIWFPKEGIAINKTLIPSKLRKKYIRLLESYNIKRCKDRLIQLTEAYIAVGDIRDNSFHGRMNGSIDLDELNSIQLADNLK